MFLEFPCFLYDPMYVCNLISGSSAFSIPSWYIWNFSIQVLLKPSLKEELPYDQVIPLLSICFLKIIIIIWKDICTPMPTGALFKIAKIWKQPKCALVDERIKRCGTHIYNGIPLSHKTAWTLTIWGFPGDSDSKESACNARDPGLIPGLGGSPGVPWDWEEGMAAYSSILAWRIPWAEEPERLESTGSQRVRHDWATNIHLPFVI